MKKTEMSLALDVTPVGFSPVTREALDEIVERVSAELEPESIYLFGSYAAGTPTKDSDVDLLIVMETDARPADRYLAISRLIRPRPFPLDIIVKTPAEIARALENDDPFISTILDYGMVLYERPH